MSGLILKLIACPVIIFIAWMLFPNVDFANWIQPIILGVIVAVVGHLMEVMMLRENTITLSTVADFVASTILVYYVTNLFFENAAVTFWGAVLTAALLGIAEAVQHRWLVRTGRAEKEPTAGGA